MRQDVTSLRIEQAVFKERIDVIDETNKEVSKSISELKTALAKASGIIALIIFLSSSGVLSLQNIAEKTGIIKTPVVQNER